MSNQANKTTPLRRKDSTGSSAGSPGGDNNSSSSNNNNNISTPCATYHTNHPSAALELYDNPAYQDALEDVHTRFILNLPESELQTADRIFFQLEQAWWFYEDWICDPHPDWNLPRFSTLKPFAQQLFLFSPLLPEAKEFARMWNEFSLYKRNISNYGCILLNEDYTRVVLCQLWNSKTWTFPSGKINQGEDGKQAAARETYEETGFDPHCMFGTTAIWKEEDASKITWHTPLREQDALTFQDDGAGGSGTGSGGKRRTCYICHGVPEDFPFAPVARKEVSTVEWHPINDIPKKTYAVLPFLSQLRRWIAAKHRKAKNKTPGKKDKTPTRDRSRGKAGRRSTPKRSTSRGKNEVVTADDHLVASGLAEAGDTSRWSEEEMFRVNEQLLGRKIDYDGNPHLFEQGFAGQDPHAFRVIGGSFLNAEQHGGIFKLAPAPEKSKLQPLFRKDDVKTGSEKDFEGEDDGGGLQPFFTDEGATPWGEVVEQVKSASSSRSVSRGRDENSEKQDPSRQLLTMLHKSIPDLREKESFQITKKVVADGNDADSIIFMTDAEITAKSQAEKRMAMGIQHEDWQEIYRRQYEQDMSYVRQWVANLPKASPTKRFGEFKLDADAIMAAAAANLDVIL